MITEIKIERNEVNISFVDSFLIVAYCFIYIDTTCIAKSSSVIRMKCNLFCYLISKRSRS